MSREQEKHSIYQVINVLLIALFLYLTIEYFIYNELFYILQVSNKIIAKAIVFLNNNLQYSFSNSLLYHTLFLMILISNARIKQANVNISKKARTNYQIISVLLSITFLIGFLNIHFYDTYIYPAILLINIPITAKAFSKSQKLQDESFFTGVNKKTSGFYFSFETEHGTLNIHKPQRNIYIDGSPGSGKSASIIEAIIVQTIEQGKAGCIYDFEGDPTKDGNPILSSLAYSALQKNNMTERFAMINLTDMTRTYRTNILKYINNKEQIIQLSTALMKNLNSEWKEKVDFWGQNAITYFAAILTRLFNSPEYYNKGYFTLPHAIALTLQSYEYVIPWLAEDTDVAADAQQIITPWKSGAEGQLSGATSSAQAPLKSLNFNNIFYVLSEKDADENSVINLDITNKKNPKILCLGNSSALNEAITPVLSCISYIIMNNMNQPGKLESIFCYDEFPTINLYGVDNFIAEARKHGISTILALQDFEQAKRNYGEKSANILRTSSANQFYGNTGNIKEAKEIAESLGQIKIAQTSYTKNEGSGSETESLKEEKVLQTRDIIEQPVGHFLGKVADGNPSYCFTQFKEFKYPKTEIPPFNLPHGYKTKDYYNGYKEAIENYFNQNAEYIKDTIFKEAKHILGESEERRKNKDNQQEQ